MTENTFTMRLIEKRSVEYLGSNKQRKGEILDQLEKDTGRPRKSLIRSLRRSLKKKKRPPGRPKLYQQQELNLITLVWEYNDRVGAERFHPYVASTLKDLEVEGLLSNYSKECIGKIEGISLGSLKLQLRKVPRFRRRISSHPHNNYKKQVPVRTGFKYDQLSYGFFAVDFVEHCGESNSGRFIRSFCMVDPKTTWLSRGACIGKDRVAVESAWDIAYAGIPYKVKGLHSDNEPLLLKSTLSAKAEDNSISISRTRPYKKEDNGHVEQKNGDKIRGLVGYRRYHSQEQLKVMIRLYEVDDLYQNHFIGSQRLSLKKYNEMGKVIVKKHSISQTAYERVLEEEGVPESAKQLLRDEYMRLNRVKLKHERDNLLKELHRLR